MVESLINAVSGKKVKTGKNEMELKNQVNSAIKETVFKKVKFLASANQEQLFMEVVEGPNVPRLEGNSTKAIAKRAKFLVTHKNIVCPN